MPDRPSYIPASERSPSSSSAARAGLGGPADRSVHGGSGPPPGGARTASGLQPGLAKPRVEEEPATGPEPGLGARSPRPEEPPEDQSGIWAQGGGDRSAGPVGGGHGPHGVPAPRPPESEPRIGEAARASANPAPARLDESIEGPRSERPDRPSFEHQMVQRDRMAALGTLAAGVAHEINNPLTYLLVNTEHVLRRLRAASASDDPIAEISASSEGLAGLAQSLQHAVEGAHRVRQIVRDLLTFSQGNIEKRGLVDIRGVVESATQMAWHEIRHRARLVRSLAEVPPVEANEARLGQVFLNLLVNAAQAVPEGKADRNEIRVATRTDERGRAIVEISDTGVGIAAEHLPRIFDPFFTTKGESGTGLGLAISHGTIKALGGEIHVSSQPGSGTTFRVEIPPAKRWRSFTPTASPAIRAMVRRRVLVVDDERMVGEAIQRALSEENDVEVVTEASHALQRIGAGEKFDIILCDLMMPVMTGMDLYAEIMRSEPKLGGRIVFMTGGAFTPRARAFMESVVNPCLEKPLDMAKLRSVVAGAGIGPAPH